MVSKRFILDRPYSMSEWTDNQIFELFNPYDKSVKKVFHAIDVEGIPMILERNTLETDKLVITTIESDKSDVLGTNVYITSSLISSVVPQLVKTIYVDPKYMYYIYHNTEMVKKVVEELERVALFIIGINKSGNPKDWKAMLKSYVDSNIRFFTKPEDHITEGEKYVYISRDDIFCDADEFEK